MIAFIKHRGTETQRGGVGLCPGFKEALAALCLCVSVFNTSSASAETYVGLSGSVLLPQGGARSRVGAAGRIGWYATEAFALEGEAADLEHTVGFAARGLWHWRGWDEYDKLFGFSRFDPFFTFGACGWLPDGQVGPAAGIGFLYYLDDNWALRASAEAVLGLDSDAEMIYSLAAGVQYSW